MLVHHWILRRVLSDDKAQFSRDGTTNMQQFPLLYANNSQGRDESSFQHDPQWIFGVVWLIVALVLEEHLTAANYPHSLTNELPLWVEDIYLETRLSVSSQHDEAPPHFHGKVTACLNQRYGNRCISPAGPVPWPPRSPDLIPLRFFLWGLMKEIVCKIEIQTGVECCCLHTRTTLTNATVSKLFFEASKAVLWKSWLTFRIVNWKTYRQRDCTANIRCVNRYVFVAYVWQGWRYMFIISTCKVSSCGLTRRGVSIQNGGEL